MRLFHASLSVNVATLLFSFLSNSHAHKLVDIYIVLVQNRTQYIVSDNFCDIYHASFWKRKSLLPFNYTYHENYSWKCNKFIIIFGSVFINFETYDLIA